MKHIIEEINDYFTESLQNISNLLMVQDYNAQNKLLIDEWSFQGLPVVLSRLHIPLQTPTVVGQKVYIPSTLIDSVPPYHEDLGESAHPEICIQK